MTKDFDLGTQPDKAALEPVLRPELDFGADSKLDSPANRARLEELAKKHGLSIDRSANSSLNLLDLMNHPDAIKVTSKASTVDEAAHNALRFGQESKLTTIVDHKYGTLILDPTQLDAVVAKWNIAKETDLRLKDRGSAWLPFAYSSATTEAMMESALRAHFWVDNMDLTYSQFSFSLERFVDEKYRPQWQKVSERTFPEMALVAAHRFSETGIDTAFAPVPASTDSPAGTIVGDKTFQELSAKAAERSRWLTPSRIAIASALAGATGTAALALATNYFVSNNKNSK